MEVLAVEKIVEHAPCKLQFLLVDFVVWCDHAHLLEARRHDGFGVDVLMEEGGGGANYGVESLVES